MIPDHLLDGRRDHGRHARDYAHEDPNAPARITQAQWDSLLELVACTHNTLDALFPSAPIEEEDHGSLPSV